MKNLIRALATVHLVLTFVLLALLSSCHGAPSVETPTQTETEASTDAGTQTQTETVLETVTETETSDADTDTHPETETPTDTETESETLPAPTGKIEDPTYLYGFSARKQSTYFRGTNCDVTIDDCGTVTATPSWSDLAASNDMYLEIAYLHMMRTSGFRTPNLPNSGVNPNCRAVVFKVEMEAFATSTGMSFLVGSYDLTAPSASYTKVTEVATKNGFCYLLFDMTDNYFFQGDWLNILRLHLPTEAADGDSDSGGAVTLHSVRFYETASEAYADLGLTYTPSAEVLPEVIPPITVPTVAPNATLWQPSTIVPAQGMTVQTANEIVVDIFTDYTPRDTYHFAEKGDIYMPAPLLLSWENIEASKYHVYISRAADMSHPIWVETTTPMTTVDYLMTGTTYYWQVAAIHENGETALTPVFSFATAVAPRACDVEGVSNIRDVGGHQLTETTRIRQGLLYRAATLDNVTAEGIRAALYDYGIRTDLDLRSPGEGTAGTGSPLGKGVRYINISGAHYDLNIKKNQYTLRKEFEVLANPDNYPILFHCTAGRDRTGTLAFLVGALLGMSEEQLYMDYELTFLSVAGCGKPAGDNRHIHELLLHQYERMVLVLRSYAPAEDSSLSEAAEAYLLTIGVSAEDIQSVKDILIEELS